MSPSVLPAPSLRVITDAEDVESLARVRQAWATLWNAIGQETAAESAEERPSDNEDVA